MTTPRFASLLLLSTALVAVPALAHAQDAQDAQPVSTQPDPAVETPVEPEQAAPEEQAPEVSIPGGAIIVTGRRNANIQRVSPQVVTVLGTEEIARTGEGDIAGALGRVTGLSVVGNGYVYVRGLGDRYSLALLNGSPLPSPEPLKRVVPLDLFPTSIIASSLVQKKLFGQLPRRIRRRRHQPDHQGRAQGKLPVDRRRGFGQHRNHQQAGLYLLRCRQRLDRVR
ncbi:TonB-dependent receptor plug domain-containing protein [Novosphingobium colocasiae]